MFGARAKRQVLVIDDEEAVREMIELALSVHGMKVTGAADGARGLAAAHLRKPDIIVLDVMMPGTDGYEVLRRIRADEKLRDTPVIMLTALAGDADQWRGWTSGADSYLTKPIVPDALAAEIRRITSS